jgi:flagellar biosynthetic protein FliR
MLTLSSADLDGLLVLFFFPFVRILAWLSFDPLIGTRAVPTRMRVAMAFILSIAIAPVLPAAPQVALASGAGILLLMQQIAVGAVLGFSMRIVIAVIEYTGQYMGVQMGLSFATLIDPINGAQTPVISQFLVLTATLILFAFNGHHLVLAALAQSFVDVPIGASFSSQGFAVVVNWGGAIFTSGLQIALPISAALLATNLTIGMMSRAAPQLNIFAIGFPLTLGVGFLVLYLTLAYLPAQLDQLWRQGIEAAGAALRALVAP